MGRGEGEEKSQKGLTQVPHINFDIKYIQSVEKIKGGSTIFETIKDVICTESQYFR